MRWPETSRNGAVFVGTAVEPRGSPEPTANRWIVSDPPELTSTAANRRARPSAWMDPLGMNELMRAPVSAVRTSTPGSIGPPGTRGRSANRPAAAASMLAPGADPTLDDLAPDDVRSIR